ncbi:MAG: polyprenyl synthetase family protein [Desulfobacterota bacterium]|nr:polyprenyl synthetase family protein [Thermodesulfobacteriota bacterium]
MDIQVYLREKREIVDRALEELFPPLEGLDLGQGYPVSLRRAIRHSLFSGGKRIRPILSMAAFEAVGGQGDQILPFACGLEMIHTYSLIHDDLPALDNDEYRRGKLTCHRVFGEAIAILAGDALLTEAFCLMTRDPTQNPGIVLSVVHEVAKASGVYGMVGGQVADIESEGKEVDFARVEYIHTHKTGALILASVRAGALLGQGSEQALKAISRYGKMVGLAFQIVDDILNIEGKSEIMGKSTGSDVKKQKATYPAVMGIQASKRRAEELVESAVSALQPFGSEADPLREIARYIVRRDL